MMPLRRMSLLRVLQRAGLYILVGAILFWTLGPYLWLLIISVSNQAKLNAIPIQWLPINPTFEHYRAMFDAGNPTGEMFFAALNNSLFIATITTFVCLVLGVLAAYALARYIFPGRNVLVMGMLSTRLLPTIALVIPFYVLIVGYIDPLVPMFDTRHNLILLYISFEIGLVVWVMWNYFATIPRDLEEAALIDGATHLEALWQITLPLASPGLVTTGLLTFLLAWDEFLLALIFSRTSNAFTMPYFVFIVGSSQYYQSPAAVAAGGVLAALPPLLLALFFEHRLVGGLTSGALN